MLLIEALGSAIDSSVFTVINGSSSIGRSLCSAGRSYGQLILGPNYDNIKKCATVTVIQTLALATLMTNYEIDFGSSCIFAWTFTAGINGKVAFVFAPGEMV